MQEILSKEEYDILIAISKLSSTWNTSNDSQYAVKGLLTEISHLATGEYFDPSYIIQKVRIIKQCIEINANEKGPAVPYQNRTRGND